MLRLYLPLSENSLSKHSLSSNLIIGKTIELIEERNYIVNVYRMRVGDKLLCFNESGEFICELVSLDKKRAILQLIEKTDNYEDRPSMNLAIPLIKPNRLEWVIEKAVEIGVRKIFLIETERSMKKNADLRRLQLIMKQAVQQSMRLYLPEIELCEIDELLEMCDVDMSDVRLCVAHQDGESGNNLKIDMNDSPINTILIGPEGGFTDSEMKQLAKYPKIKLANGILRSETAALLGLYALNRV